MTYSHQSSPESCPLCGLGCIQPFISIPQVPVYCNVLWATREEALAATRGDIELGFCRNCGYVYNKAFEPALMEYTQAYENSLHFSPRFQAYADDLARQLIERHNLRGKDIIELGSGKGDFLRLLCQLGGNRGVGFDPSYVPEPDHNRAPDGVRFVPDYYSGAYAGYEADMVVCRHVLEHIPDPGGFLAMVRGAIGERPDTVVFFEVPNMEFTLRDLAIWDIIYEHCSYFVSHSLKRAFSQRGFHVTEVAEAFAGQFLVIEALPAAEPGGFAGEPGGVPVQLGESVVAFGDRYRNKVHDWTRALQELAATGQKAVIWGAGSKGVTFLNVLDIGETIRSVVDINPRKQGMYVAGSGQQIVPPEALRHDPPDVVVIMNAVYEQEIGQTLEELGLQARVLCA